MKFLIDAQLPPSLKQLFTDKGFDCIHTLDLESGNDTPDQIINKISVAEQRILITRIVIFLTATLLRMSPIN